MDARRGTDRVLRTGQRAEDAIWAQSVAGATAPERLVEVPTLSPIVEMAPDGRSLLVQSILNTAWTVQRVSLDSNRTFSMYSATGPNDVAPRISPDGRWAAITTNESGRFEIYVRSYPDPGIKVQISVGGGGGPAWSADGTRLYYVSGPPSWRRGSRPPLGCG